MTDWWSTLSPLTKFFYLFAVPSTIILLLQSLMTLIGFGIGGGDGMDFGDGDMDMDMDVDMDFEPVSDFDMDIESDTMMDFDNLAGGADFRFVTFRGIIAFCTMFGWIGAALAETDLHLVIVMLLAIIAGLGGMFIIAILFYTISRLQQSGNLNYRNAIGKEAQVYIPIPPSKSGLGKVQMLLQESLIEVSAVTEDAKMIGTNEMVRVVDMLNATTLVVERLE